MTSKFQNTIKHRMSAGIITILALSLVGFILTAQGIFADEGGIYGIGLIVAIALITAVRILDVFDINSRPAIFMGGYNLVFLTGVLFFMAPFHPLAFLWVILLIRTQAYLGDRWTYAWWAVFAAVSFGGIIISDASTRTDFYFILTQVVVTLIIVLVLHDSGVQQVGMNKEKDDEMLQVAQLQHRLEMMFNNVSLAIFGLDATGAIVVYNHAALEIINQNAELHGVDIDEILTLSDGDGTPLRISRLLKEGGKRIDRNDINLHVGFVEKMPVNLVLSKFNESYSINDGVSFVLTVRDITRQRDLEHEQSDFISIVSHELRTPTTIAEGNISNAQLVNEQHDKNMEIDHALKIAHEQIGFLAEMVNNISTLSQAEKDELDIKLGRVDPALMVQQVEAAYSVKATEANLKFVTDIEDNVSSIISSRTYITDILNNLIENSLKYTDEGTITLGVKRVDKFVHFFVSDTGIGISHADAKHVFDKFFRAEDHETQTQGGTGLGLYVASQLADRINAELTVESKLGVGSTFTLKVPRIGALKRDLKELAKTGAS